MAYGVQISKKFHEDGTAARYPGNTVIADVRSGNPAYETMLRCLRLLETAELDELFIPLPQDSFHMTVIRGVNDLVRTAAFWPAALPADVPMAEADAYMHAAVASVPSPGPIRMRFERAVISDEDFRIRLKPADEAQHAILRAYRDAVADAVGLKLPGHDSYTYHMTLAYTWHIPGGVQKDAAAALIAQMDALLAEQPEVLIDAPHFAWYQDMLSFSAVPVDRF